MIGHFWENPNLSYLELRRTNIVGGYKDGSTVDNTHVISENTFRDCVNLQTFFFRPILEDFGLEFYSYGLQFADL